MFSIILGSENVFIHAVVCSAVTGTAGIAGTAICAWAAPIVHAKAKAMAIEFCLNFADFICLLL